MFTLVDPLSIEKQVKTLGVLLKIEGRTFASGAVFGSKIHEFWKHFRTKICFKIYQKWSQKFDAKKC